MSTAVTPRPNLSFEETVARVGIGLGLFAFVVALPSFTGAVSSRAAREFWWPASSGCSRSPAVCGRVPRRGSPRLGGDRLRDRRHRPRRPGDAGKRGESRRRRRLGSAPLADARLATPLAFAAIGGMFSERSGVVNIGLEGMMLAGAFFGVLGADKFGSWEMGLVCAAGLRRRLRARSRVHGDPPARGPDHQRHCNQLPRPRGDRLLLHPGLRRERHSGTSAHPRRHRFGIKASAFLGNVFGDLNLMIWASFALLIVAHVVLFRTPVGLRIRAVGEHPRAADTVGISVYGMRYAAVILSGTSPRSEAPTSRSATSAPSART